METEMDFSDGEQTNGNSHVTASQYFAPPGYNRSLVAAYGNGNTTIGLEKGIERRLDHHEQLPGYIFMCNGRTKTDCYRYRVFGIPRGGKDVVESIKPGMKLFLYDFEKRLLYGVYEATVGGRLDIEPEAFEGKYPAQVGFRIVMNCLPLTENTFKSAIYENYKGSKFKQELSPHQVMSLLSLFRSFTSPELDLLPHRLASRASAPRTLSFEERFIAATHLRNASSVLDPLSARHVEPRLGSVMAHQPVPRTSLLQHSYFRQDDYTTPPRESLSNLNQPYYPTEARQLRLLGDPSRSDSPRSEPPRSSIQDPQLKYLTILSNIRRYGSASDRLASENEYHPATPSEKDQFAVPYSDNKNYPSTLSGSEHPSASAANGSVYRSEFYNSASQKEGEASQQHEIPAGTYHHPEASTVSNTTKSMQPDMQAVSVAQSHTETAGYPTPAHGEASQPPAGAIGYTHQPQNVAVNKEIGMQCISLITLRQQMQPQPIIKHLKTLKQSVATLDLRNLCVMGAEAWTRTGALSGKEGQGHKTRVSSSVYCTFESAVFFVGKSKIMGNCCSDVASGAGATAGVGGSGSSAALGATNDALDYYLKSKGFNGLFSQIELSFSASNLRDRDVLSKSDPMVVVYQKEKDATLSEVFRSEVVLNSLAPKWIKKFIVAYHFETVQTLVFRVYDVDTKFQNSREEMLKLDEQQFLGEATCALSEIITKSTRTSTLELKRKDGFAPQAQPHHGKLIIHAEESLASKISTEIVFRCSNLESKDLFSKSDPFLVVSKIVEHGTPIPVSKTEVRKNDLNPIWKPVFLSVQQVGSKDSPVIIECSDFNSNGKHSLIGKVQKSLSDLEKLHLAGQGINFSLPTGAGQNKVLKSQLFVDKFTETVHHTFLEYLASGFELNFMVAIDFTASNGNPRLPDSLHYIDPSGRLNAYQRAIMDVGEVLQFYDSDKRFPAWGFGARPIDAPVSHCFNLNGSSSYSEVDGIQGIMTSYTSALFNVSLAGPTLFGPVINAAAMIASASLAQDADKGERLESSSGRLASRDIVQFVALRDVQYGEISVVQALLAELPSQFLTYMRIRNMKPIPP
ncbi:unnamed protein product [Arabidopsis thaliana]|uniref:(thale cress) hypothetical protein n=2 Tax=Arabidopsis thaliana TaxID=3702 RepID=A0A7G2FI29_ARATH|nr:unnamed protein product [Arabidopsis thaliana]